MAAMSARQHNPDLKAFYLRLIEAGKKPLVAIIAVARKLITIINAKVRDAQLQPIEHLRMTPLCFANPSPPSGWMGDFHSLATEHAGHTTKSLRDRIWALH